MRCRWNQKRGLNVRLFPLRSCHRGADATSAGCWGGWVGSYLWAVWFVVCPPLLYSVKRKRVVLGDKFQPLNRRINAGAPRKLRPVRVRIPYPAYARYFDFVHVFSLMPCAACHPAHAQYAAECGSNGFAELL